MTLCSAPCTSSCALCIKTRLRNKACIGIKKRWTILVPSDAYLLDPRAMLWIAKATKKLRKELALSRRDYADRMAGAILLFEGGLRYRGGLPYTPTGDFIGRAYNGDLHFTWMTKLEAKSRLPAIRGKHHLAARYRVHYLMIAIRRPCWLDSLPK